MNKILLAFLQFLWNLKFIFSGSHNSSSSVLLQLTNYIYSLSKMRKRMRYGLNYPGTRFWKIKITQFPDGFRLNSSKANSQPRSRPRKYHIKEFRRCVSYGLLTSPFVLNKGRCMYAYTKYNLIFLDWLNLGSRHVL